jgi:hypothetical protein
MACFLVPAAEAVVVGVAKKIAETREPAVKDAEQGVFTEENRIPFTQKLGWLFKMLIGGAILLAFEHLWHGEVVPWFPFLTNASNPADAAEMLHEMSTIGVTMAIIVTVTWAIMMFVADRIMERPDAEPEKAAA